MQQTSPRRILLQLCRDSLETLRCVPSVATGNIVRLYMRQLYKNTQWLSAKPQEDKPEDRIHIDIQRQLRGPELWPSLGNNGHCQMAQEYAEVCLPVKTPRLHPFHTTA